MPSKLLSHKQVADLLGCSVKTVGRLVEKGLLAPPMVYNGVGVRFEEDDVVRYLRTERKPVPPKQLSSPKLRGQDRTGADK